MRFKNQLFENTPILILMLRHSVRKIPHRTREVDQASTRPTPTRQHRKISSAASPRPAMRARSTRRSVARRRPTTISISSPTFPVRRSPSTPSATSRRTASAPTAGTPRTGWSPSTIPASPARRLPSPTTGSAGASPSPARRPVAAARSRHSISGAARTSARRAMRAAAHSADTTTKASTCPARRRSRCTTASTISAQCGGCSPVRPARRPTVTIRTVWRYKRQRRSPTSSMAACFTTSTAGSILQPGAEALQAPYQRHDARVLHVVGRGLALGPDDDKFRLKRAEPAGSTSRETPVRFHSMNFTMPRLRQRG